MANPKIKTKSLKTITPFGSIMVNAGDSIKTENANWKFGGEVVQSFSEHIAKSVPFYECGHNLIVKISDFFLNNGSVCYDLGCSNGTLLKLLLERNRNKNVFFRGLDNEKEMIKEAKKKLKSNKNIDLLNDDLLNIDYKKCDFVISYYTMQFVKPKNRQIVFDRIFEALNWGGAFLLFEKVRGPDARFQDIMTSIYTDYKLEAGYSPEEIVNKSSSLKGVLEPFSTQGNIDLLKRAGFVDIMSVMKYVCFEGFLAIK